MSNQTLKNKKLARFGSGVGLGTGFTLIEILLIIGVLSIIAAFSAPIIVDIYNRQVIISTSEEVFSAFKKAQSYAEYRKNGSDHGVRFLDDDTYVLFQGSTYAGRDSDYDEIYPLYGVTATTSPALANTEIIFTKGTGAMSATTTLSLSKDGVTKDINFCESNVIEYDEICNAFDVASFDGTNDSVGLGTDTIGDSIEGAAGVTIAGWLNHDGDINGGFPMMFGAAINSTLNGVNIRVDNSSGGTYNIRIGGRSEGADSYQSYQSSTEFNWDQWYYVAGVLDFTNDMIYLYIDGSLEGSDSVTFGSDTYTQGTAATADSIMSYGSYYLGGLAANFALYSEARSADDILADYQRGYPNTADSSLVSYWPMLSDYTDYAGSSDGTQSGGVTFVEDLTRPDTGL